MQPTLEIKNLTKKFGTLTAVDHLNMQIFPGDAVAFIGQNGAGKSTTMRMIAGLSQPNEGSVQIAGTDMHTQPLEARKHLGYVPQDMAVFRYMTGLEYLTLIAGIREIEPQQATKQIDELIELCDLKQAQNRLIREYSGGMARKIAMAGALIGNPELIVLDESFVGLDPESTFKLGEYLKNYTKNGGALLISSHVLDMLYHLCSRFFILHHGKSVSDIDKATLSSCLESPETPSITAYYLKMTDQAALITQFADAQSVEATRLTD